MVDPSRSCTRKVDDLGRVAVEADEEIERAVAGQKRSARKIRDLRAVDLCHESHRNESAVRPLIVRPLEPAWRDRIAAEKAERVHRVARRELADDRQGRAQTIANCFRHPLLIDWRVFIPLATLPVRGRLRPGDDWRTVLLAGGPLRESRQATGQRILRRLPRGFLCGPRGRRARLGPPPQPGYECTEQDGRRQNDDPERQGLIAFESSPRGHPDRKGHDKQHDQESDDCPYDLHPFSPPAVTSVARRATASCCYLRRASAAISIKARWAISSLMG
jgi:hypothetical protein